MNQIKTYKRNQKSSSRSRYWPGWRRDAAKHFGVTVLSITNWQKPPQSAELAIKHRNLIRWVKKQLKERHNLPDSEIEHFLNIAKSKGKIHEYEEDGSEA